MVLLLLQLPPICDALRFLFTATANFNTVLTSIDNIKHFSP